MNCIRNWAIAVAIAMVAPAFAEDDKKLIAFDATKLVGDWTISAGKKMGKDLGDDAKKGTYTFGKDMITLKEGDKVSFAFSYTIEAKTTPMSIDMEIKEAPMEGLKGSKAKGILELKGDELKLTYDGTGGERPKKFDDDNAFSFTLKRAKKVEKKEDK